MRVFVTTFCAVLIVFGADTLCLRVIIIRWNKNVRQTSTVRTSCSYREWKTSGVATDRSTTGIDINITGTVDVDCILCSQLHTHVLPTPEASTPISVLCAWYVEAGRSRQFAMHSLYIWGIMGICCTAVTSWRKYSKHIFVFSTNKLHCDCHATMHTAWVKISRPP